MAEWGNPPILRESQRASQDSLRQSYFSPEAVALALGIRPNYFFPVDYNRLMSSVLRPEDMLPEYMKRITSARPYLSAKGSGLEESLYFNPEKSYQSVRDPGLTASPGDSYTREREIIDRMYGGI